MSQLNLSARAYQRVLKLAQLRQTHISIAGRGMI
jgi:hypothetical protein